MTCETTHTWPEFEFSFLSAFFSDDDEVELVKTVPAFKVRMRVLRIFFHMYRSLCYHWKPDIMEEAVIKLICRNINPRMASQLRGRVKTVEELVILGLQLEKDKQSQTQNDQCKKQMSTQKENKDAPQSVSQLITS